MTLLRRACSSKSIIMLRACRTSPSVALRTHDLLLQQPGLLYAGIEVLVPSFRFIFALKCHNGEPYPRPVAFFVFWNHVLDAAGEVAQPLSLVLYTVSDPVLLFHR